MRATCPALLIPLHMVWKDKENWKESGVGGAWLFYITRVGINLIGTSLISHSVTSTIQHCFKFIFWDQNSMSVSQRPHSSIQTGYGMYPVPSPISKYYNLHLHPGYATIYITLTAWRFVLEFLTF